MWEKRGLLVTTFVPSPNDQAYCASFPVCAVDPAASNTVPEPIGAGVSVKYALGVWSGVRASPSGCDPAVTADFWLRPEAPNATSGPFCSETSTVAPSAV